MSDAFYRSFEDRFRGSRELVKCRLGIYLPFVESVKALYPDARAIDLGCGRGEWLELLLGTGIEAKGVDIDENMLSACRDTGLDVEIGSAVSYLQKLPDDSMAIVSAFHLIEHIPFIDLQILVQEALRVLKPAGLLILESPNSENIVVGTVGFYMDPTHQRPIPPPLLAFLPEYYGFGRTKILRLQEPAELLSSKNPSLADVFNGVSPDYAIVAQKNALPEELSVFSVCFGHEYGLTLGTLSAWYDEQLQAKINQAISIAEQAQAAVEHINKKNEQTLAAMQQAVAKLDAVSDSRSWRITALLRWIAFQLRLLKEHGPVMRIKALVKKCAKPLVSYAMSVVDSHPLCVAIARKFGVYEALRSAYFRMGPHILNTDNFASPSGADNTSTLQLDQRVQQIYNGLMDAIDQHKGRS